MKTLITGLGSIGRRHTKNLKFFDPSIDVAVLREHSKDKSLGDVEDCVNEVFFDKKEALHWHPDVVFVTNPAPLHVSTALDFAKQDAHLFMEKPLSTTVKEAEQLLKTCKEHHSLVMVGYVLRFLEPLKLVKETIDRGRIGKILSVYATVGRYLPEWRPGTDYRENVSAREELGGGVIFELSHELDYVRWLAGEITEVSATIDKISDFEMDVEDIAEINLRFENNAVGHVHLDMMDRASQRSCRIVGSEGTITWNLSDGHRVRLFSAEMKKWQDLWYTDLYDPNQMYLAQIKHFFDCVRGKKEPLVNGEDGKRIVEVVLAAKESAKRGKSIKL